ncbi:NAD(P)-binding protein [Calocera viscosa TUFC12733]|uniref:NAD(P)-binding protein n=1 Tax=Calocera viscosa (strain TUFC12733) TaxID=1330018 RepID=A0A167KLN8_CALVF|nr:NAD(P)-binding protein [Calocera viscosa TUFC12733]
MVDACLANQVPLFVWSSLPSMKEMTGGKYDIPSLEDKAAVDEYIKGVGQPTVTFYTGAFTENLLEHRVGRQLVRTSSPQKWDIHYPIVPSNIPQPMTYVAKDLGPAVLAVIDHWEDDAWKERLLKEPIVLCSYTITGAEMADTVSKVTGKDVKYVAVPADLIREPVKTLFSFFSEYWYPQEIPERILKDLGVSFHSFEDYVREEVVPFLHGEETSN